MSALGAALRNVMARSGYLVLKKAFVRYGYDLFVDIGRIGAPWGWRVETVFDVGANIGQFASDALAAFPGATVHSFEPHPVAFEQLKAAISDPRFVLHQLALGEERGEATLYDYGADENDAAMINSLVPDSRFAVAFGYEHKETAVRCETLDTVCAENGVERIDLLKVDTEGFDLFVLKGAERMLRERRIRFVYVEFNDVFAKEGTTGGALAPIAEYLGRFGMRYMVTYTDFVMHEGRVSVCANALFACPPENSQ